MLVMVYYFTLVVFVFFRDNVSISGQPTCDTLFECFTTMISYGSVRSRLLPVVAGIHPVVGCAQTANQ
jgi:hypothetical protein